MKSKNNLDLSNADGMGKLITDEGKGRDKLSDCSLPGASDMQLIKPDGSGSKSLSKDRLPGSEDMALYRNS